LGVFQIGAGTNTGIGEPFSAEFGEGGGVNFAPSGLDNRRCVRVQTQPPEVGDGFGGGAGFDFGVVEILDAQYEASATGTHRQPREQKRARVAEVQGAGRAWGEAAGEHWKKESEAGRKKSEKQTGTGSRIENFDSRLPAP